MKKIILLLVFAIFTVSCGGTYELLELKVNNDLTETIDVSIPKTTGATSIFNLSKTIDLRSGDFADYIDKISAIKITSFTYRLKNFSGNSAGTIPLGNLKFDNTVVSTITNLNVSQEVNSQTIFTVTDSAILSQLENTFLNNTSTKIIASGNALSDEGSMNFVIEVNISLTATITE